MKIIKPNIPIPKDIAGLHQGVVNALGKVVADINQQSGTATTASGGVDGQMKRVENVAWPTAWYDAVPKIYLDNALADMQRFGVSTQGLSSIFPCTVGRDNYGYINFDGVCGGSSGKKINVGVTLYSIDDTDTSWAPTAGAVTASATTLVPGAAGVSRFGTSVGFFNPGDYFIWNDTTNYEIGRIVAITSGTWTIQRGALQSTPGIHGGVAVYRLCPYTYLDYVYPGQRLEVPHTNKVACAAVSPPGGENSAKYVKNLASLGAASVHVPSAPGLRTMNGAAYVLGIAGSGTTTQGTTTNIINPNQTADAPITVQAWESLRSIYFYTPTAGTVSGRCMYITADRGTAGFLYDFSIVNGTVSYPFVPDGINMPFDSGGWPLSPLLTVSGALSVNGTLTATGAKGSPGVTFKPDGYIDFIVANATAVSTLIGVVQT